jgi:hypothetical protein
VHRDAFFDFSWEDVLSSCQILVRASNLITGRKKKTYLE